ncbi:aminoglycoside phosphotransferase family protein [Pseudonocardia petroleophila]|uniref:Aminoglycoside phosphotransferase family protein n=1 Tax=Pseudonocardia petroleophila TaxID=37331 RepID=A0A7G7MNZ6_9PSEU|nr:aminoglycoside phosphotransferase family protein [Pseudonocardia petroleophila]QNG54507.1 aminoglycoside phosphotransferase family protein [Pseudonocardia petroleophila]
MHPIDETLVRMLVAAQFPQWADLPVVAVPRQGVDNRTFRLGESLSVRLPSAAGYVPAVEKELRWLPRLAPALPLPIPVPVAAGAPSEHYPWPWSVRRWIDGTPVGDAPPPDPHAFARDLAGFLLALGRVDASGGPVAGAHSFHRGADPAFYDDETRRHLTRLPAALTAIWDAALAATWHGSPVWFHGDVAAGNLLLDADGRLAAVIDFGTCGVGDPACDLVIAWTLLDPDARATFRTATGADDAMWARGRGWALWKAAITDDARVLDVLLAEPSP